MLKKVDMTKPMLRGHFHQGAFFIALGASAMLVAGSHGVKAVGAALVYGLSLTILFGVSSLYHRLQWQPQGRAWMRRLDHSAIFILIAGTGTPICLLALNWEVGSRLLLTIWVAAGMGMLQSLFWVGAPKWVTAVVCVAAGWVVVPYVPEIGQAIGHSGVVLLLVGGVIYSVGALVYALKRPNPFPKIFGYHEIFHILVVLAAIVHFVMIARIVL